MSTPTVTVTPNDSSYGFKVTRDTNNNYDTTFVRDSKIMSAPVIYTIAKVAVLAAAVFVDLFLNVRQALTDAAMFVASPITSRVTAYNTKKEAELAQKEEIEVLTNMADLVEEMDKQDAERATRLAAEAAVRDAAAEVERAEAIARLKNIAIIATVVVAAGVSYQFAGSIRELAAVGISFGRDLMSRFASNSAQISPTCILDAVKNATVCIPSSL